MIEALQTAVTRETSVNTATKDFNSTLAVLQKNMFTGKLPQQWTYWLKTARMFLEHSGCSQEDWGSLILGALATGPQQSVLQNLDPQGDTANFTYDSIVGVMEHLYGATDTPTDYVKRLEVLKPSDATVEAFGKYQSEFLTLAAHVGSDLLTDKMRCELVLRIVPKLVRVLIV